jgi:hypothetical protein
MSEQKELDFALFVIKNRKGAFERFKKFVRLSHKPSLTWCDLATISSISNWFHYEGLGGLLDTAIVEGTLLGGDKPNE